NRTERNCTCRCKGNDHLRKGRNLRLAEAIDSNNENPHHRGPQTIEPTAHSWCRTEVRICECKRQHNAKGRKHKTQSRKKTAPQTAARISEEHAELCHRSSRNQVGQGHPFDKAFLRYPLSLFLQLGLQDTVDGGPPIGCGPQL